MLPWQPEKVKKHPSLALLGKYPKNHLVICFSSNLLTALEDLGINFMRSFGNRRQIRCEDLQNKGQIYLYTNTDERERNDRYQVCIIKMMIYLNKEAAY